MNSATSSAAGLRGQQNTLFAEARRVLPRGVSSSARLRSAPLVFERAEGVRITDVEGRSYTDFVLALGPMLLGHGRTEVLAAVRAQLERGVLFGNHEAEIRLAELLCDVLPHADKVAFANSGSEATNLAVRIAKATTGRANVVKFEGHYHGWLDPLFVNAPPSPPTSADEPRPTSVHAVAGASAAESTLVCRWNDLPDLEALLAERGSDVAAVIMEPFPFNFGTFRPDDGYLESVRKLCHDNGSLLIFDEVLSGFRVALGGAAEVVAEPDIGVYAKAMASGFPIAAVAGTDQAMRSIVEGPVHPAGTYSGSPVAVSAALATLHVLVDDRSRIYPELDEKGAYLRERIESVAVDLGVPLVVNQIGSVLQLLWNPRLPVRTYADACRSDREAVARICEGVLEHGSLVTPRGLILLSTLHEREHLDRLVHGLRESVRTWL